MPSIDDQASSAATPRGLFTRDPLTDYEALRTVLTTRTPRQRRRIRSDARSRANQLTERERNGATSTHDHLLLREARLTLKALEGMEVATSRGNTPSTLRAQLRDISTELAELEKTPKARRSDENKQRIRTLRAQKTKSHTELSAEIIEEPGPSGARQPGRATRVRSVVQGGLPGLGGR